MKGPHHNHISLYQIWNPQKWKKDDVPCSTKSNRVLAQAGEFFILIANELAWGHWLHWWGHGWWITFSNVNWMNLSRKQHFESFRSCLELNLKWKSFAEFLLEMKMPMFQQLILSSGIQGADLNQHGPVQGKPQRPNCIHWRRPWRRWCLGIVGLMAKCQNICFLVDMKAKEE